MRLSLLLTLFCMLEVHASVTAQVKPVDIDVKDVELKSVFEELTRQTDLKFFFNHQEIDINSKVTVRARQIDITEVLGTILGEGYEFEEFGGMMIIKPVARKQPPRQATVRGSVADPNGNPLIGASVILKGTTTGIATDANGWFSISIPVSAQNPVLVISYLGMHTVEVEYRGQEFLTISLEGGVEIDEVVVTGLFDINKSSFSGSVKSMTGDDLKQVSNTNLIQAISMLTPGLKMMENNEMGSNPNALPEIILRGTSSLSTDVDVSPNQPLLILDGVQISLRDLYDLDINEIERVDVLKDASATALYGERAANGVIVVVRKQVTEDRIRVSYNFDGNIEVPDIRTYNYLNAVEKLEFELLAGMYNFENMYEFEDYNRKKLLISKGLDTDWMSKPLRTGYTLGNSLNIMGRGNNMTYRVNANMRNAHGVMKGDYRNTYGMGVFLSYNLDRRLTVSLQTSYSATNSKASPYGSFSSFVQANPYDSPYGEDGKPVYALSWDDPDPYGTGRILNPLYEAKVGNYSKGKTTSFTNSLHIRWDIIQNLYLMATGTITKLTGGTEDFLSPTSATFSEENDLDKKGSLAKSYTDGLNYEGNVVVNYNWRPGDDYILSLHAGGDIARSDSQTDSYTVTGFSKNNLNSPGYAMIYPADTRPGSSQSLTTRLGVYGNLNFMAFNRYFVDASIRRSGSSTFGANNRYAPFWSAGVGWNIHNEAFMPRQAINLLRLRYSYGVTGSVEFSPYQAITTYEYSSLWYYLHGMGAIPKQMGNDELTWQSTKMHNMGLNAEFLGGRFSLTFDYYIKTTDDLLIDLTIPPSVGEITVKRNLGKTRNEGFELDLSAILMQSKDWRVILRLNMAHNTNKILHISNALKAQNEEANADVGAAPRLMYEEGRSLTAIYAVRSAGINPATGEEVFIKKNGEYTTEYDANDKAVLGDLLPKLEGYIFPSLHYKGWSLNIALGYKLGGQVYNTTRASNVENVDPRYNVDKRAYYDRWKEANDVKPYLDIANLDGRSAYRHTGRFVEDENTLEITNIDIAYDLTASWLRKVAMRKLRLSVGMLNPVRFSTVKYERGISYPFSRGFSFTISPTF